MTNETRKLYAQALEQTALAYARKRDRIQYDSTELSYLWCLYGGPQRLTDGFRPEDATKDAFQFSVCSSFFYNFMLDTFGFRFCEPERPTCRNALKIYKDHILYEYHEGGDVKERRGIHECLAALEEGDALIIKARNGGYHIMLRLSENRIAHCAGIKINMTTGEEKWEHAGAIRIDDIEKYLCSCLEGYPFYQFSDWWVLRVLDAVDPDKYPLTPQAQSRMKFPGLNIDRTASLRRYQTVQPGETITYTLRLRNENLVKTKIVHENLLVEETIPQGTTLVESSLNGDVMVEGDRLRWNVTVRPLQEHTLQYTVRVNEDVAPGTFLVSEGSRVDDIPGCVIRTLVSRPRLSLADCAKIRQVEEIPQDCENPGQWLYQSVLGKNVTIPSVAEVIDGLYQRSEDIPMDDFDDERKAGLKDHILLKRKQELTPVATKAEAMAVPGMLGGQSLGDVDCHNRILEFRGENLYPGDVVLSAKNLRKDSLEETQFVVLGGGKCIMKNAEGTVVTDLPYMDIMLATDYFTVLRPYLAGFEG